MATLLEQEIYTAKDKLLIDTFKSTYNARYLKDFEGESGLKQEKIRKLYSELKAENKHPVLVKLIENLFVPVTYNERFIEGPWYLIKMKQVGQTIMEGVKPVIKSAYIFGESHLSEQYIVGSCPEPSIQFQEYLFRLAQTSPAFIDFYFEDPIVKSDYIYSNEEIIDNASDRLLQNRPGTYTDIFEVFKNVRDSILRKGGFNTDTSSYIMNEIYKKFLNCASPSKRDRYELCKIIRFHNIDIREGIIDIDIPTVISIDIVTLLSVLYSLIKRYEILNINNPILLSYYIKMVKDSFKNNKGKNLLDLLIDNLKKEKYKKIIKLLHTNKNIKNQYTKSYEKDRINRFIISRMRKKKSKLVELGNELENLINNPNSISGRTISQIETTLAKYLTPLFMDYYGLLRIFKTYLPRENDPEPLDHPVQSTNIIIYAGQSHSQNYSVFFNSIGFEPIIMYTNPNFNLTVNDTKAYCVDMKQGTYIEQKTSI